MGGSNLCFTVFTCCGLEKICHDHHNIWHFLTKKKINNNVNKREFLLGCELLSILLCKHFHPSRAESVFVDETHSLPLLLGPFSSSYVWMWASDGAGLFLGGWSGRTHDWWVSGITLPLLTWMPMVLLTVWLYSNWDITTSMQHKAQSAHKGRETGNKQKKKRRNQ